MWEDSQVDNARLRLEINTARFDLEIARQQLAEIKVTGLVPGARALIANLLGGERKKG